MISIIWIPSLVEWQRISTQFGFVVLFSVALPIAPALCLVWNLVTIRNDARKFIYHTQRVVVEKVEGLGAWLDIFQNINSIAIIVNMCILSFTSDIYSRWYYWATRVHGTLDYFVEEGLSVFDITCFNQAQLRHYRM